MNRKKFEFKEIAVIRNDYTEKFGIPRQSGLAESCVSEIVFKENFRNPDYIRGIEKFSHLWLVWVFSESPGESINATVRPPKLGGNEHIGVFASRSPFRPNPIGISSVKIIKIDCERADGPVIFVSGADLMNGTPILDIKPYLPYSDSHPEALGGYSLQSTKGALKIECAAGIEDKLPSDKFKGLKETLSHDPRPSYQNDENRVYTMAYGGCQVSFKVSGNILTIVNIS